MTFGERLVYARNKKRLNQKQLAELIGVRRTRLCSWEKGRRDPDAFMIEKIVKVLEVSKDWLMGNDDNFNMENITETLQYIKLTKWQQKLVTDNEVVIGAAFKFVRKKRPTVLYDDIYGDAAIGLCRAAEIYGQNGNNTASFFSFAFTFVQSAILNSHRKAVALDCTTSLNEVIFRQNSDGIELGSQISAPDEWEQIEYKILAESLYQNVESALTVKEKESFRLMLHGMNNDEIARALGVSKTAVKDRLAKARNKCRSLFNPEDIFSYSGQY